MAEAGTRRRNLAALVEVDRCSPEGPLLYRTKREYCSTDRELLKSTLPSWGFDWKDYGKVASAAELEKTLEKVREDFKPYEGVLFTIISGYGIPDNQTLMTGGKEKVSVREIVKECFGKEHSGAEVIAKLKLFIVQGCFPKKGESSDGHEGDEKSEVSKIAAEANIAFYWSHIPGGGKSGTEASPMISKMCDILNEENGPLTINDLVVSMNRRIDPDPTSQKVSSSGTLTDLGIIQRE